MSIPPKKNLDFVARLKTNRTLVTKAVPIALVTIFICCLYLANLSLWPLLGLASFILVLLAAFYHQGQENIAFNLESRAENLHLALSEARRREKAILENALDVICSLDEENRFVNVSPAAQQIFGYSPSELRGKNISEITHQDDIKSTLDALSLIKEEEALTPFESRLQRKDERIIYVLWTAFWSLREHSMFMVAHDITERKEAEDLLKASEARTRSIIDQMPVGLALIGADGKILLANPQMERLFDFKLSDLVGEPISMLFPKEGDLQAKKLQSGSIEKLAGHVRECDAQRRNGSVFPVEVSAIAFATENGPGFLMNILDVSERHEMEKLKREFVTTVSHELRTPLTAIRGSLTLLSVDALGTLTERAKTAVRIAERNSLRLINLINDLLDIEKLSAGKMEMMIEEIHTAPVVERALEAVKPFADQYGIKIIVKAEDLKVHADGDRLIQVLLNLLSNGCKYSPLNQSLELKVKSEGDWAYFAVSDCGRGIPEDALKNIFERFQQVETADAKRGRGTGLGLAISKAIIEEHGGEIGVTSQPGRGSTFWFTLPKAGSLAARPVVEPLPKIQPTGTD